MLLILNDYKPRCTMVSFMTKCLSITQAGFLFVLMILRPHYAHSENQDELTCEYESIVDAIPGGVLEDTSLFKLAIRLSGEADNLPPPNGTIGLTVLIPTNKAFLSMLWKNGFFIPILSKVNDVLPATLLYNVILGTISPEMIAKFSEKSPGIGLPAYAVLSSDSWSDNDLTLRYMSRQNDDNETVYSFMSSMNEGKADAKKTIKACNTWLYITDEVLVPTSNKKLKDVKVIEIPDNLPWSEGASKSSEASDIEETNEAELEKLEVFAPNSEEEEISDEANSENLEQEKEKLNGSMNGEGITASSIELKSLSP